MRKLRFEYSMELKFSSPVSSHYFALRCVPGDSLRQKITLVECRVSPADYTSADKDGFGNLKISGGCRRLHDMFRYYVAGTAVVQGMTVQKRCCRSAKDRGQRQLWTERCAPCMNCIPVFNISPV